jgi:hypothetical protein
MAQIVAVTRFGDPRFVIGNCNHEPCTLGGIPGANFFWAEVGAYARYIAKKTEEGGVKPCKAAGIFFMNAVGRFGTARLGIIHLNKISAMLYVENVIGE